MGKEQILYFPGGDIFTLADNDVLDAPGDADMACRTLHPQVTSTVETIVGEGGGGLLGAEVTLAQAATANPYLAGFTRRGGFAILSHDAHFHTRHRAAIRVGQLFIAVGPGAVGHQRCLGHAVGVQYLALQFLLDLINQFRGFGGAAT